MTSKPDIDDYDLDDAEDLDDDIVISEEDDELDDAIAKTCSKKGLLKRREIDDLLERRRLERELRDDFDSDFDSDFDDDWDDDWDDD